MTDHNITGTLSPEDIQEIKAALQIIQEKMPFLIALTAQERRKLFKMGDKSLAFVNNSVNIAQSNREIFPASFDIEEFIRDYQLATTLSELLILIRQLSEQVDDTLLAVGSEAMISSLTVYKYVKTAAKKTPSLKTVAELLSDRFKAINKGRTAKSSRS
ncbi:hypothetical protein [Nostoc sp. WHI]|uniref:hypothetical protein n=1 Tax=Nostoc sp. WHI TaxID=2650611 RepID=UPI0018C74E28|nr:hypothetical protein [Nostoc sp. WHI]MBG1271012.1 hypothetical protein [Nostoc sp. WHI]